MMTARRMLLELVESDPTNADWAALLVDVDETLKIEGVRQN